jgi:hypothetical protein
MDMASLNGSTFASLLCAKPAILLLSSQPSLKLPIGAVSAIGSLLDKLGFTDLTLSIMGVGGRKCLQGTGERGAPLQRRTSKAPVVADV